MENKKIIIDGILISYATAGIGEKALIFLHGWRSNKEAWLPIVKLMENSGYRLFFIDLPGFGASEIPHRPYTLHDYAETVCIFVEKLNLQNPVIIGHSAGARIAIKLAVEYPDLFQKLILVASGGARPPYRGIKKILAKICKPFFAPRFMAPLRAKIYGLIGAEDYLATPELQKTFLNIVNEDLNPLLSRIKTDTLIIWGDKDETAPLEYGRHMTRLIPNARLEIIAGASHYCFQDAPQAFTVLIKTFLTS